MGGCFVILTAGLSHGLAEDGLVGDWRPDAATGSVVDRSGNGHVAQAAAAKIAVQDGRTVLVLDDQQGMAVPSCDGLNLQQGFSIVVRLKTGDLTHGRTLAAKDKQYQLRLNSFADGNSVAFFPYVDGAWEPRVSSPPLASDAWYHLAATWDGQKAVLWVNGMPYSWPRAGQTPPPNDAPLQIAAAMPGYGSGGYLECVKVYRRTLSPSEIICDAFDIIPKPVATIDPLDFDFADMPDPGNWIPQERATAAIVERRLVVGSAAANSLIVNPRLNADVGPTEFISLRMAVDKGSRARLLFVTTKGAEVIPFQTFADGKSHTYVLDMRNRDGWGGTLLALGLLPSEIEGSTARIEHLQPTKEVQDAAEIQIDRVFSVSTLPRARRTERIVARIINAGGPAKDLAATLSVPEGVSLKSPPLQTIPSLNFRESKDAVWDVEADKAGAVSLQVTVAGPNGAGPVVASQTIRLQPDLAIEKASYVPVPVPAKTNYTLWTHYCPLWKTGTHAGWEKIEPWPERKPVLGWYNEGSPQVADWHIKYMVEHGISGMIYCWYRASGDGPVVQMLGHAIHDGLLKARYLPMIKFGIMWENAIYGVSSADDLVNNLLPFWIDNYFSNPSYARIDGKPVLYVYVPSRLTGDLGGSENVRKTFDRMRAECERRGLGGLYLVGCVIHESRTEMLKAMSAEGWDATSSYVNGWQPPARVATVGDFVCAPIDLYIAQQQATWDFKRRLRLLPDITAMTMGWDSRPWKETEFFFSENSPEKFRELCRRAKAIMDAPEAQGIEKNTGIFCCWNEFGEGHYIEPTRGDGFAYLDVIRDLFCEGPQEHTDIVPEDVGLAPDDSWYREARKTRDENGKP